MRCGHHDGCLAAFARQKGHVHGRCGAQAEAGDPGAGCGHAVGNGLFKGFAGQARIASDVDAGTGMAQRGEVGDKRPADPVAGFRGEHGIFAQGGAADIRTGD